MEINRSKLENLIDFLGEKYDLLLCSSSFESRCLSVPEQVKGLEILRVGIFHNVNYLNVVKANTSTLQSLFGDKSEIIELSTEDPIMTADNMVNFIDGSLNDEHGNRILVDITTFTHESLLILIKLLSLYRESNSITLLYSNADDYGVGGKLMQKWLSRGVGSIRTVLGYPGIVKSSKKVHLIIIVGYEYERALTIIEQIEPTSIALGYGKSGSETANKNKEANEKYMQIVRQAATSIADLEKFQIPSNDPIKASGEIIKQIDRVSDKNVIIVPMNNKLTTVGSALAAMERPMVQVCYARALAYNYFGYSQPGKDVYIFDF